LSSSPDPQTLQQLLVEAVRRHNVLPFTGLCNLSCCFCSHGQNPPGARAYTFPPLDTGRLLDLIPFLDPDQKIIIGESATRLREGEPLTHPDFFTILERLRRHCPDTLIQVTTNGSLLDGDAVRRLAALKPLELVLSLNSATGRGRRLLMNDPRPATAAVEKIIEAGIPLHGSVVALPHLVGWDDLQYTLEFLDGAGAKTIRLLMPGFTRITPPGMIPPPDTVERCRELAGRLRQDFSTPLLLEPPLVDDFDPFIEGIIAGSPAAGVGLKTGDLILRVNDYTPVSRVDAFHRAREAQDPCLTVLRHHRQLQLSLAKKKDESPGFTVSYDLDPAQLERVRRCLRPGQETLMLVSPAAYPLWLLARESFGLEGLSLVAVQPLFFGGNIRCAGLLTVSDFAAALRQHQSPGRVLVPAVAFDSGGRDMQGHHFSRLNAEGVAVILVE